jgi:hypothetical protein
MAIKPKLQSLLASANEVTGEERTNLTDAVQDLVDGYGQGGSKSEFTKIFFADCVFAEVEQ